MKRNLFLLIFILSSVLFTGCHKEDFFDLDPLKRNFKAVLTSEQEVRTPPVESGAQGQSYVTFSKNGSYVKFSIEVTNLDGVTMAHLHKAPFGVNGPVVVTLLPRQAPSGLINGTLVEGTFSTTDPGNSAGIETLEELRDAIEAGLIYVNVHTEEYPGGEIRGQLK